MKKSIRNTLIVTGSIAGALILTIVILSAIVVKPLDSFISGDYNVSVIRNLSTGQNEQFEDEIKDELKDIRFSVMRAILEGNTDYGIKNRMVRSDGEDVPRKIATSGFLSISPSTNQFMLEFSFSTRTYSKFKDVDGKEIRFNRLLMIISESANTLQTVTLYPYLSTNLVNDFVNEQGFPLDTEDENGRINSQYYSVHEFVAKMPTSGLYNLLLDKGFTTGTQNV